MITTVPQMPRNAIVVGMVIMIAVRVPADSPVSMTPSPGTQHTGLSIRKWHTESSVIIHHTEDTGSFNV